LTFDSITYFDPKSEEKACRYWLT